MLVRLLRDARIKHYAGETVNVSPEECAFLTSTGSAVVVTQEAAKESQAAPKKTKSPKKG